MAEAAAAAAIFIETIKMCVSRNELIFIWYKQCKLLRTNNRNAQMIFHQQICTYFVFFESKMKFFCLNVQFFVCVSRMLF